MGRRLHAGARLGTGLLAVAAAATCARAPVRSAPPDPPWAEEVAASVDGGVCKVDDFALTAGFCRVRVFEANPGNRLGDFEFASVPCGESRTYCGVAYRCSCAKAVEPFPCEPNRAEGFPYADRRYSWEEYQHTPDPSDYFGEAISSGATKGCSFRAEAPRYSACKVRGDDYQGGKQGYWIDWIPFGEAKEFCGVRVPCNCEGSDAGARPVE